MTRIRILRHFAGESDGGVQTYDLSDKEDCAELRRIDLFAISLQLEPGETYSIWRDYE